jgi:TonB family protein
MKKISCLTVFYFFPFFVFSQATFDLTGNFPLVKQKKLTEVKELNELIVDYPSNWITSYISVEITTTNKGILNKASGQNNVLTNEQVNNLKSADLLSNVFIKVNYLYRNSQSGQLEKHTIEHSTYIAPERNAKFENGQYQLHEFLRSAVLGVQNDSLPRRLGMVSVKFTVNEGGEIVNPKVFKSSGDLFTDMRLLNAISTMPKWKPAENNGTKLKQEFLFSFGGC